MKTIKQQFFALVILLFIAGCSHNGSGTDEARRGSVSTQPGEIENTTYHDSTEYQNSTGSYSPGADQRNGNKNSNDKHYNTSPSDSTR